MLKVIPSVDKETKEHYQDIGREIVHDALDRSDGEFVTGEVDGISFKIKGEWQDTCCVGLYCPGNMEFRADLILKEDGWEHHLFYNGDTCEYQHGVLIEKEGN